MDSASFISVSVAASEKIKGFLHLNNYFFRFAINCEELCLAPWLKAPSQILSKITTPLVSTFVLALTKYHII